MTMRDLKLDPVTGDISLSAGDVSTVSDGEAIVQAIKVRLSFFLGEWFLAQNAGIPYFQNVLVKNPDANLLQKIFREAILETPGVLELLELALSFNRATRSLSVAFRVLADAGELSASVGL